jgi:hypothetical protein
MSEVGTAMSREQESQTSAFEVFFPARKMDKLPACSGATFKTEFVLQRAPI